MGNTYVKSRVDVHCPGQPENNPRSYTKNTENKERKREHEMSCSLCDGWITNE